MKPSAHMLRHPVHFLSLGFGSGLAPVAPGTFGTLAALPLYLLLSQYDILTYLLVTAGMTLIGIWLCGRTAQALGAHDHPAIVWDEVVGYFITMAAAPDGWGWMVLGFVLFRLFDIVKPWPIRVVDRQVEGGLGIMLDDVLAGVMAWLVLQATVFGLAALPG